MSRSDATARLGGAPIGETADGDEIGAERGLFDDEPFAGARYDSAALRRARRRSVVLAGMLAVVAGVGAVSLLASPDRRPWFQGFDDAWRDLMIDHRTAWLVDVAEVLSVVGSSWVTVPLRLVVSVTLAVRRRWVQFGAFVTAIAVSELFVGGTKALVDRPRPPAGLVEATSSSFPSGHAIAAAVTAFGLVIAVLPRGRRRWHWIVGASLFATIMAWSRTYLSVHWATDTIGGTAIGVACALLAEAAFEGGRWEFAVTRDASGDPVDPAG